MFMKRIVLWFGSLLLSVTLFSLSWVGLAVVVFRATMIFAFPVACLYVPFVLAFKDAEGRRIWTILFSGILLGPASLALWGLILQLRGDDPHTIWQGDPLIGMGGISAMIFALIVGSLTTFLYVIALKVLHHTSTDQRPLGS
jgi:hypothetical protein